MIRDVEVIGAPSLFYSDFTSKNDQDRSNKYDIVIFDVTPHNEETIKRNKITFYYGKYEMASKLLTDVIEAAASYSDWKMDLR